MVRVTLEFWMGPGKDLGGDFRSLSELSSILETEVEDGIAVTALFQRLAGRYPPISEKVFDREKNEFYPSVVVTLNERVIGLKELYEKHLSEGDKITVVPMYVGG
jgi:molybdopterin converting factor small subunit